MALTLPITRDIVVSEKRNYVLAYTFCDQGVLPSSSDIVAKAFPRFAHDALFVGFLGANAENTTTRFFSPGEKLWRRTGTKQKVTNGQLESYNVATTIEDADAINLPFSISGGKLNITIPFGTSFSRYVEAATGVMSTDDMYLPNSPAKYIYAVMNGTSQLGGGIIDITIDLSKPVVTNPEPPTVCSVQAT